MDAPEILPNPSFSCLDSYAPHKIADDDEDDFIPSTSHLLNVKGICNAYQSLLFESDTSSALLEQQKINFLNDLTKVVHDVYAQRDIILEEMFRLVASCRGRWEDLVQKKNEEVKFEVDSLEGKIAKLEQDKIARDGVLVRSFVALRAVKESLEKVIQTVDDGKPVVRADVSEELQEVSDLDVSTKRFYGEFMEIVKIVNVAEIKVEEYHEMRKNEKRDLESSVVSLTEENQDINSLLRIALVEKETIEKNLNRLKGNTDQKRVPLLQFGLQKVGFGFMMGAPAVNEQPSDNSGDSICGQLEGCEEERVTLASTMEKIMKNLRLEITQLRQSLNESRSDTERLQALTEKQALEIAEKTFYIKGLEERETLLAQNVRELLKEMKETEEEVCRWREACELEVDAGKHEIGEHEKVVMVTILKQELEKTRAALQISDSKLKLKEQLAGAAMAAQAAAERSLHLSDGRAAILRERIEELTRQLEEDDAKRKKKNKHWMRHVCWPWQVLRLKSSSSSSATNFRNIKKMVPEMQALLPHRD